MTYLLCQSEPITGDEPPPTAGGERAPSQRIPGSTAGLSCAFYLIFTLLPRLSLSRTTLRDLPEDQRSTTPEQHSFHALVQSFEQLWDVYIALGGGALDAMEHSDAVMVSLDEVRRVVLMAVSPFVGGVVTMLNKE